MQDYELKVLEQYPIVVKSTRKARGAFFCDTDRGLLLLKEAGRLQKRVPALHKLYIHLQNQGYDQVDQLVANENGEYVTFLENEVPYILKRWFPGRELDIRKNKELMDGIKNLARLHSIMKIDLEEYVPQAISIREEYYRHNKEMKKVRKYIRGQPQKGEFELLFLKCFEEMYQWADIAGTTLEGSSYEKLYQESIANNHLTHGEYNYHNILVVQDSLATTNFDKCKKNIQAEDIYYYLRKAMEKHAWNIRLCDCLLNAYCAVKPLTKEEIEYIKIKFLYPEKFWKITDLYYRSNKAWIPSKNVEKLKMTIAQTNEKRKLINEVFRFDLK